MQRAFLYRLYPTPEQEQTLLEMLETCRHLYNNALAQRIDAYKHEGRTIGYVGQANQLPTLKKSALSLCGMYSHVAQDCLRRLDKAYQNFIRRVKAAPRGYPEKPGFPRFKGIGRYRSFTYPSFGPSMGARMEGEFLHLSKIGDIRIRLHRPLQGVPKTCTLSRKADGWYCSIACEVEPAPLEKTGLEVGIDVGIENFATLSDNHAEIPNPRLLQKAQAKLRKAQRRLERRTCRDKNNKTTTRQSNRRAEAKALAAKAHLRVARARMDFHQKTANALVRKFDTLYRPEGTRKPQYPRDAQKPSFCRSDLGCRMGSVLRYFEPPS